MNGHISNQVVFVASVGEAQWLLHAAASVSHEIAAELDVQSDYEASEVFGSCGRLCNWAANQLPLTQSKTLTLWMPHDELDNLDIDATKLVVSHQDELLQSVVSDSVSVVRESPAQSASSVGGI